MSSEVHHSDRGSSQTIRMESILSTFAGVKTAAYIDTLCIHFRFLPSGTLYRLNQANEGGGKVFPEPVWVNEVRRGTMVFVHQPTLASIRLLSELQCSAGAVASRLDVAVDWLPPYALGAAAIADVLVSHLILPWRSPGRMHDEQDTVYWVAQGERTNVGMGRSNRDLIFYRDRPSKITGELEVPHLELRFYNARAVRGAGYQKIADLPSIRPNKVFDRYVRLVHVDFENFNRVMIREHVKADRLAHLMKNDTRPKDSPAVLTLDRYRVGCATRVRLILNRQHRHRAQLLKDSLGLKFSKTLDMSLLKIPDHLEWPA